MTHKDCVKRPTVFKTLNSLIPIMMKKREKREGGGGTIHLDTNTQKFTFLHIIYIKLNSIHMIAYQKIELYPLHVNATSITSVLYDHT